jgi:hypothetical protein
MAAAIAEIHGLREEAGRSDRPFEVLGMGRVYVGEPGWDVGPCLTGKPEQLAEALSEQASIGVTTVGLRFPSRSADELLDQVGRFGREVLPILS